MVGRHLASSISTRTDPGYRGRCELSLGKKKTHYDDEEINDLLWVSSHIQNEREGDSRGRPDNDDNLELISDRSSAAG